MNRRQFSTRLGAALTAPLVPSSVIAKTLSVAKPSKVMDCFHPKYNWGAFYARMHGHASPQFFEKQLGMSKDLAVQVHAALVRDNILGAPNAAGIARALDPLTKSPTQLANINAKQRAKRILEKAQEKLIEDPAENPIEENPENAQVPA